MKKLLVGSSLYLGDWAKTNPMESLKEDFKYEPNWAGSDSKINISDDVKIIVAYYTYEHYSGDALVIYEEDGKLYEVKGGHCSCYGLEGQWEPDEVNTDYIKHKNENGYWVSSDWSSGWEKEYEVEIKQHLDKYINKENEEQ